MTCTKNNITMMKVNDFVAGDHLTPLNFSMHPQQPEKKHMSKRFF